MARKINLWFAITVLALAFTAARAQPTDPATDAPKNGKAAKQEEEVKKSLNKYPAKPKDVWELGIHAGYLQYNGDVNEQPGYAYGIHVRKSLGYVFSLRAQIINGVAYGLNYLPSQRGVGKNNALGVYSDLPIAPGTIYHGYGNDLAAPGLPTSGGTAYKEVGSRLPYYYNYKSYYTEGSIQGILTLNNLKFHKERNKWDIFLIAGVGLNTYETYHDALDANGKLYDFTEVSKLYTGDNAASRRAVWDKLNSMLDHNYETHSEEWGGLFDPFSEKGDNAKNSSRKVNPIANLGVGVGYKLSKRFSITLEHQATFNDDDLLDGYRWSEQGDFTQNKDVPHYTNLRLNIHLGDLKKRTEPLWWLNPLDAPYADIQKMKKKLDEDLFKDSDGDGVPDQLDKEPNTPADCPVDTHGVALDSDGDGVKDCDDKEPYTPAGIAVDPNGVGIKKPLYDCADCFGAGKGGDAYMPMLHFDATSYCIKPEYQASLKQVATMMKKNEKMCLTVEGYADDRFAGDQNVAISYNRAKAVVDFLANNYGIDRSRMTIKAKGEDNIVKNGAASDRAMEINRRVELKVSEKCGEASDAEPAGAANVGTPNCIERPSSPGGYVPSSLDGGNGSNGTPSPGRAPKSRKGGRGRDGSMKSGRPTDGGSDDDGGVRKGGKLREPKG